MTTKYNTTLQSGPLPRVGKGIDPAPKIEIIRIIELTKVFYQS